MSGARDDTLESRRWLSSRRWFSNEPERGKMAPWGASDATQRNAMQCDATLRYATSRGRAIFARVAPRAPEDASESLALPLLRGRSRDRHAEYLK